MPTIKYLVDHGASDSIASWTSHNVFNDKIKQ